MGRTKAPSSERSVADAINRAILSQDVSESDFTTRCGTSGCVDEILPTALHCFLRNKDDFHTCVTTAVNLGGDTDTRAFFAGQLWGAMHGASNLPAHFIRPLEDADKMTKLAKDFFATTEHARLAKRRSGSE